MRSCIIAGCVICVKGTSLFKRKLQRIWKLISGSTATMKQGSGRYLCIFLFFWRGDTIRALTIFLILQISAYPILVEKQSPKRNKGGSKRILAVAFICSLQRLAVIAWDDAGAVQQFMLHAVVNIGMGPVAVDGNIGNATAGAGMSDYCCVK